MRLSAKGLDAQTGIWFGLSLLCQVRGGRGRGDSHLVFTTALESGLRLGATAQTASKFFSSES